MSTKVDIDHLRKWIGKIDNVTDYVTPIVEQRYRATLNMDIGILRMEIQSLLDYIGC